MNTERYQALMDAAKILLAARTQIYEDDGRVFSPIWRFVCHAQGYIERQADEVFRAEEVSA